jgi:hypothetical protein
MKGERGRRKEEGGRRKEVSFWRNGKTWPMVNGPCLIVENGFSDAYFALA